MSAQNHTPGIEVYVTALQLSTLLIRFEDMFLHRDQELSQVFDLLDFPPRVLEEKTKKHASDDLGDNVTNLDELEADFTGSRYVAMFEEVLNPSTEPIIGGQGFTLFPVFFIRNW